MYFNLRQNLEQDPFLFETNFQTFLFENDFKAIFPELFLVLITLFLLLYGVIYSTSSENKYPLLLGNISWLSVLGFVFTFFLLSNNPITHAVIFYNTLILDDFTLFLKFLVLIGALFSVIIALDYVKQEAFNAFEYMILILLSTCSMLFLIASADFISMYLAIELQSLCFYVLAASKRNSEFSTEAGLKYFLLGAFSSGILLFGCSLIYGFTGVTNFSELAKIFNCGAESATDILAGTYALRACELGMIFILVGFLFKMTAVPFHMWAPDVYEGAPTSVTAFFSIVPKISILAVLIRLFIDSFYDFMLPWQKILIFCSLASMILGAFAAMSQNKIKRLLAFSSIGHVGYLLVGICCGTVEGLQALFIYLVIYIVMTINIFSIVLIPIKRNFTLMAVQPFSQQSRNQVYKTSSASKSASSAKQTYTASLEVEFVKQVGRITAEENVFTSTAQSIDLMNSAHTTVQRVKYTTDFSMLSKSNPLLAFTLTVTLFSIAGIPPLAGFYSKAFLFFAAMSSTMYLLALVGVITSVISCFYYIRLIKIMYFETPQNWCSFSRVSKENSLVLGISLFFILFFMLYPTPLYLISHKIALALCS